MSTGFGLNQLALIRQKGEVMDLQDKILGSLLGAAIGDAMGAATELRTKALIKERFGGEVRDIIAPPDDTFARGSKAGSVTDDFSLIYYTMRAILDHGGVIDKEAADQAILNWSADEAFYNKFAGPTTRAAVEQIKGVDVPNPYAFICCDNAKASNGSAMKIAPAGIFHPGDLDRAVQAAIIICRPTHNNNLSIAGACAIAAAVSEALRAGSDLYSVVQAGLYGVGKGTELASGTCAVLAGPDVQKRIKLAIEIGLTAENPDQATTEIADLVGSGLHVAEAVPAVFGIMIAAKGNPMDAIVAAVNIGSDTDTIACMTGAILGALHGKEALPEKYLPLIEQVNGFKIAAMAEETMACLARRKEVRWG